MTFRILKKNLSRKKSINLILLLFIFLSVTFIAGSLNNFSIIQSGIDNFTDMIGDETIATDPETLVAFLTEKGHPALGMDPLM